MMYDAIIASKAYNFLAFVQVYNNNVIIRRRCKPIIVCKVRKKDASMNAVRFLKENVITGDFTKKRKIFAIHGFLT